MLNDLSDPSWNRKIIKIRKNRKISILFFIPICSTFINRALILTNDARELAGKWPKSAIMEILPVIFRQNRESSLNLEIIRESFQIIANVSKSQFIFSRFPAAWIRTTGPAGYHPI